MKKFTKNLILFFFILLIPLDLAFINRIIKTKSISWKLPIKTHILFLGASHIEKGINDSIYPSSLNLASSSERYLFTYLKLNKLLESNTQIDTIFLQFAPTDIWENCDFKYYAANEMSYFLPLYFPFFQIEEWKIYLKSDLKQVITILYSKLMRSIPNNIYSFGGYHPLDKIFNRNIPFKIPPLTDLSLKGHSINFFYLKKIENVCLSHGIKLYYLYMPVFNAEKFNDQNDYYKTYNTFFSNSELLDYSKWVCPDNYREDENHLNKMGANYFTKVLFDELQNKSRTHNK